MTRRLRRWATLGVAVGFVALPNVAPDLGRHADDVVACHPMATASQGGRPDPDSAQTCAQCHPAFYKEWKGRGHSQAWVDKTYQKSLEGKKRPQLCHGCHIPAEVHARLGRKPKPRPNLHDEGVTCVSCHRSDGKILGPFGAKTDAHPGGKDPTFTVPGSDQLCASCHSTKIGPVLPLGRDHKAYRQQLGNKAKGCVECHMPEVERHLAVSMVTQTPVGQKRKTRSHEVLGPGDVEFCKKAFGLSAATKGGQLELTIENGAGHRIPGLKIRSFVVEVVQLDAAGKELGKHTIDLNHENGLAAVERRAFPMPLAAGARVARVAIDHVFEGAKVATILTQSLDL